MPLPRKQTRLPAQYYVGPKSHFITICCDSRRHYLGNAATAEMVREYLLDCARRYGFVVRAYCLMPNHLHMLVQGTDVSANLTKFMRIFKSRTAFAFQRRDGRKLWEMSYYDHILRESESAEDVAHYIWWNPVRGSFARLRLSFVFLALRRFRGEQNHLRRASGVLPGVWARTTESLADLKVGHYTTILFGKHHGSARVPHPRFSRVGLTYRLNRAPEGVRAWLNA
jgi:putative transposase